MTLLFYDCYNVLAKVYQGGAFIKQALNDTPINEKNRAQITKICYGVIDKDILLEYYISKITLKSPKQSVKILMKIALYSIVELNKPVYGVTDGIVELSKKLGKSGVSGFLNATIRNFDVNSIMLPSDNLELLSVKYSYPKFLLEKLIDNYGVEASEKIISYNEPHTFVRLNYELDENYLIEKGIEYLKTPFENCFLCNGLKMDDDFYDGKYTFQSIGSVAICNEVPKGEKLLDCCAAPGGKSVCLSNKFSSIESWDIHEHRVKLIDSYASRMGVKNVTAKLNDASKYDESLKLNYDVVLVDAPCSGSGVIFENPDIKLNRKEENIIELNKTQLAILFAVSNYVKIGGYLVYSTCSILKEENDKILEKFLKKNKNFEIENINSRLEHLVTKYGNQFLPHISMGAGFFVCKLKRVK